MKQTLNITAIENVMLEDKEEVGYTTSPCEMNLEPHEFQVEDFSPDQANLRCVNCGKVKWL